MSFTTTWKATAVTSEPSDASQSSATSEWRAIPAERQTQAHVGFRQLSPAVDVKSFSAGFVTVDPESGPKRLNTSNSSCKEAKPYDRLRSESKELAADSPKGSRPIGESARPGRGGFNLEEALAWDFNVYNRVKDFCNSVFDLHLDYTKVHSHQADVNLTIAQEKILEKYPELEEYPDAWPMLEFQKERHRYKRGQLLKKAKTAGVDTEETLKPGIRASARTRKPAKTSAT